MTVETMNDQISEFGVTFGVQYKYQPHPYLEAPKVADGYVVIEAPDEENARKIARILFEDTWSRIYSELDPLNPKDNSFYPLGEIARYSWEADRLIDATRQ